MSSTGDYPQAARELNGYAGADLLIPVVRDPALYKVDLCTTTLLKLH